MRRVAITGFGVVSPVGAGRGTFWRSLAEGKSGIGPVTHFDASSFDVRLAGEVKARLELPEHVTAAAINDPKVGFAYAAGREAMEQAGLTGFGPDTLLHLGVSLEVFDLSRAVHKGRADFAALADNCLSGGTPPLQTPLDTAARLLCVDYGAPGVTLTNCSACAAGAQAIGHGFHALRSGRFEAAVCGGFDSMLNPLGLGGFQILGALTTDNDRGQSACRPFDASRSGAVLGEGAAVMVLEPLDRAIAAGKAVLGEVCGYGSSLDAYGLSAPDSRGEGAVRAMRAAISDAGIHPEDIRHINAHGTGTVLNDEIEAMAIRGVFDGLWEDVPVSSIKSVTGHMIAAAGAVEAGACLAVLNDGLMPRNPFLSNVGRGCELRHVTEPGEKFNGGYILSNSFGFGGQNATLILKRHDD